MVNVSVGGYYGGGAGTLWKGSDSGEHRVGFIGAVAGPDINVNLPGLKKLVVVADVQTGKNLYGATGGGVSFYFNDNIAVLTGPVYFPRPRFPARKCELDVDRPTRRRHPVQSCSTSPYDHICAAGRTSF